MPSGRDGLDTPDEVSPDRDPGERLRRDLELGSGESALPVQRSAGGVPPAFVAASPTRDLRDFCSSARRLRSSSAMTLNATRHG